MRTLPISVIIPHYNRPQFLQEALDSIQSQTLPPAEIIVVDDCSTAEVRRDELQKFRHIAKIHENSANLGVSETRNIGVELAEQ
jgi:glycosyltransferase involved in cell wall biosynthesis